MSLYPELQEPEMEAPVVDKRGKVWDSTDDGGNNKAKVLANVLMNQDMMIGIFEVYFGNPFLWLKSCGDGEKSFYFERRNVQKEN